MRPDAKQRSAWRHGQICRPNVRAIRFADKPQHPRSQVHGARRAAEHRHRALTKSHAGLRHDRPVVAKANRYGCLSRGLPLHRNVALPLAKDVFDLYLLDLLGYCFLCIQLTRDTCACHQRKRSRFQDRSPCHLLPQSSEVSIHGVAFCTAKIALNARGCVQHIERVVGH